MRIYHTEDATAKFELKRKSFGRELKESLVISREDAQWLLKRDFTALLNYDSDVAEYAYDLMTSRLYRPVSLIEYDRRAYTYENFNTRITLDNHLRYCDFCYDLYSDKVQFTRDYTEQVSDGRGSARQIFHVMFKLSLVAAMVVIIKSTTRRLSSKDTFSQVSR